MVKRGLVLLALLTLSSIGFVRSTQIGRAKCNVELGKTSENYAAQFEFYSRVKKMLDSETAKNP